MTENSRARTFLDAVGQQVKQSFIADRSLMSFDEYMEEFLRHPRRHSRSAAQYLRDMFEHFGVETIETPRGERRRYTLFDQAFRDGRDRVVGHEEAQDELHGLLNSFVRERRVNRLILLHGPNGSAKSSLIHCIMRGLERYSHLEEGALYRFNWVFPTEKISRAAIGFGGEQTSGTHRLDSYAMLSDLEIDAKLLEELRDTPLLLIPLADRQRLLDELFGDDASDPARADDLDEAGRFVLSDYVYSGELSHKSQRVYEALLTSYNGDWREVMKHVQVERFYISRRYRRGAVVIEPQLRVDAASRQITADRSLSALPSSLQNQVLYEPQGDLVEGNRGVIEFNDLLKRPPELNKYLLATSEKGTVALDHAILYLDAFLIGSANEDYLEAFKASPDYSSFKGRMTLVRMPYMLDYTVERQIYEQLLEQTDVTLPFAPHTTEMAALWAVLTRLVRPRADRYPASIRDVITRLTPLEKADLYAHGQIPDGLESDKARELRASIETLFEEGIRSSDYEGRHGISPREVRSLLLRAANRADVHCVSPLSLFAELRELVRDPSIHPFLRLKPDGEYRKPSEFINIVKERYTDIIDIEVRRCMGLIDETRYEAYFGRYVQHVSNWLKGEKIYNRVTGRSEEPSQAFMAEVEKIFGIAGKPREFRGDVISKVAAFRIDNPDAELRYEAIFPDLFESLRESFYTERRKTVHRIGENLLTYIRGDRHQLTSSDLTQVELTLKNMREQAGYCDACAREVVTYLIQTRYG